MGEAFTLHPVETPPLDSYMVPDPDSDVAPKRPKTCAISDCENPVALTPTGRQGKYCEEHGAKDAPKAPKGEPRLPSWPKAGEVETALNMIFKFGGAAVKAINTEDGTVIATGGPAISKALVDLGRSDRKLRKYLEMMTAPGKYGPLTIAVAGVVIPILVNHNVFPTFRITVPENSSSNPEGV